MSIPTISPPVDIVNPHKRKELRITIFGEEDEGEKSAKRVKPPEPSFDLSLFYPPQVLGRGLNKAEEELLQRVEQAVSDSGYVAHLGIKSAKRATYFIYGLNERNDIQKIREIVYNHLPVSGIFDLFAEYYFAAAPIAVFKPADEVRGGLNAIDLSSVCSKIGIEPRWEIFNEIIAVGLRKIPLIVVETTLTSRVFNNGDKKRGVLQQFIPQAESMNNLNMDTVMKARRGMSMEQFQRMAIGDLSLCNTDRHLGNLMVTERDGGIHQIDQTLILPVAFASPAKLSWILWEQANQPFSKSALAEIDALDFEKDKRAVLSTYPTYPSENLETMRITYYLLQYGAEAGLTPLQIGSFLIGSGWQESNFMNMLYAKSKDAAVVVGYLEVAIKAVSSTRIEGQNNRSKIEATQKLLYSTFQCQPE